MSAIESPWMNLSKLAEREGVSVGVVQGRSKDRRAYKGVYYQCRPVQPGDAVGKNTRHVYRSIKHETPKPTMGANYEITRGPEAELTDRLDGVRMLARDLERKIDMLQVEIIKLRGALDDERDAHKETRLELHRERGEK